MVGGERLAMFLSRGDRFSPGNPNTLSGGLDIISVAKGFDLQWSADPNQNYIIEYSPDLKPGSWQVIGNVTSPGDFAQFIENSPNRQSKRQGFYRRSK